MERFRSEGAFTRFTLADLRGRDPGLHARFMAHLDGTPFGVGMDRSRRIDAARVFAERTPDRAAELWTISVLDEDDDTWIGHAWHEIATGRVLPVAPRSQVDPNVAARRFAGDDLELRLLVWWATAEPGQMRLRMALDGLKAEESGLNDEARDFLARPARAEVLAQLGDERDAQVPAIGPGAGASTLLRFVVVRQQAGRFTMLDARPRVRLDARRHPPAPYAIGDGRWRGVPRRRETLPLATRRIEQLADRSVLAPQSQAPDPRLKGDAEAITAAAETAYRARRERERWRRLLPPEDGLEDRAEALVSHVNRELLDLNLPPTALEPSAGPRRGNFPPTAVIRPSVVYPGVDVVEVTERHGGRNRTTAFLWAENPDVLPGQGDLEEDHSRGLEAQRLRRLLRPIAGFDGVSLVFHAFSASFAAAGRIELNRDTAPAFVRLFCDYVHGAGGPFRIVEAWEDAEMRGFWDHDHAVVRGVVGPMRVWDGWDGPESDFAQIGCTPDEAIILDALVVYGGGFFRSVYGLSPGGQIAMFEDNPILEDVSTSTGPARSTDRFLLSTFNDYNDGFRRGSRG